MRKKSELVALLIHGLPASVRTPLLRDQSFQHDLGLEPLFQYPLDAGLSAETRSLHEALRAALAGRKTATLVLNDNKRRKATLGQGPGGKATIIVSGKGFSFKDADLLAEDVDVRVAALERVLAERPLSEDEERAWLEIARIRAFSDDEYDELMTELSNTPEGLSSALAEPQGLNSNAMMPSAPQYYHRLTAKLGDAATLQDFRDGELKAERASLMERNADLGLRRAAFGAVARRLGEVELFSSVSAESVRKLLAADDPYSLVFGFELCCAGIGRDGGFSDLGEAFLNKLFDNEKGLKRCEIYSACALVAMVEIRRAARASAAPVFWTRHAAFTHAGVLVDALARLPDTRGFWRWAMEGFYGYYNWSGVVDKREAPGWRPEWIAPEILYAQLFRRVCEAFDGVAAGDRPLAWFDIIERSSSELRETGHFVESLFCDPFEGLFEERVPSSLRVDFPEIEAQLRQADKFVEVPGLAVLVYASTPSQQAIDDVLRLVRSDSVIESQQETLSHLNIAVQMALDVGSHELSQAVIDRCLVIADSALGFSEMPDLLAIVLEGCAVHGHPGSYRESVGKNAARFVHFVTEKREMTNVLSALDLLVRRDPKLAPPLAKARSILRMKLGRI
jgi:hypothetical protein